MLSALIHKFMSTDIRQQLMRFDSLYGRLVNLKTHFAPSQAEWSAVLQEKIFKARTPSPSQNLLT